MLKRSAVIVALAAMLFTILGIVSPSSSNAAGSTAASASASSSSVVCRIKRFNRTRVVCPTSKLRGPRGPRGATGPQGPAGPAGPPGTGGTGTTSVKAFKFLAIGNTPNTTIATFTGAVAEAGCVNGTFNDSRIRATADNGAVSVLNLQNGVENLDGVAGFDTGNNEDLDTGPDDQYGLTYMSAGGAQNVSAHYYAADDTGIAGVFDCAIYGTVQVS